MIVGDRDEALQIFDFAMARRAPPRLAVRGHRHVPVARVHAVLARRPDRRRGGARRSPSTRPRRGATGRTRCSGTPRTSSWCLTERGDLAGARQRARARARSAAATPTARATGATRGSSCWSPRAATRTRSRPPTSTRARFARYHNPAAARWSSLKAVALDALGMKRKAIELAAEELDRARDWGAPGHGRALAARARAARGRRGARARRGGGRGRLAARRRGWSWPSRSPRSASPAAAPAARTTRASR